MDPTSTPDSAAQAVLAQPEHSRAPSGDDSVLVSDAISEVDAKMLPPVGVNMDAIRIDYLVMFVTMHLLAMLVFLPYFFSWTGVVLFFAGVVLFGQLAVPIGFHRLLAHKSFKTPKWFERVLVTLAMCSAQETPAQWVAWHRKHHSHSDQREDPHSPRVGFFWSHMDWMLRDNKSAMGTFSMYEKYAKDILSDPFYMWIEKLPIASGFLFFVHAFSYLVLGAIVSICMLGFTSEAVQFAGSIFVWGLVARTVWVWHITWAVNSLSHVFGYRNYETSDDSRNNWFVTLLTAGEGWHNNHHADPSSASNQHRWWEIDLNYYVIRMFGALGLAHDIIPPRHVRQRNTK